MKKLYTFLALVITLITFAQAPQGFNYQATVRNSAGALIVNQNVNFKFNIMLNSATSLPVFSETHMAPTDDLGQVNLVIGTGTATIGTFSTINWGTGNYYLGIELNTGAGYVAMGTTQLLSVPYALYANSSGNTQAATPNLADVLAVNNGANNLQIKNLAEPTDAEDAATKNYVDNATSTNTTLTDGSIFVGNASNVATGVTLSGDVTISNTGVAIISDDAVTTSKIADVNVTNAKLDKANIPLSGFGAATADVDLGTKNIKNLADPTDAQDAVTKAYTDSNSSPWIKNTTNDSISYDKRVFIGSSTNQFAPSLTVYGTDTGPTSPSAKFIRSRYRNNVLLFETSEPDNDYQLSLGLLEGGENDAWPNCFSVGLYNGTSWKNPFRIYYDNNAIRLGYDNILNYTTGSLTGSNSMSLGYQSFATGNNASTLGSNSSAIGNFSTAIGFYTTSNSVGETVVGMFNENYSPVGGTSAYSSQDNIFTVGNGTNPNSRSNALTIKKSGEISVEGNQIKNLANPTDAQDAVTKSYLDTSTNRITNRGDNSSNPTYLIPDNTDIYVSEEGSWNSNVILPTPTQSNNFLANRIGKLLLLRCASSFSYNILTNNTNLSQNINLTNTQSALFIFDGFIWKKIF